MFKADTVGNLVHAIQFRLMKNFTAQFLVAGACLLSFTQAAYGELFVVGVKGGAPLTDAIKNVTSGDMQLIPSTKRYTIGPTIEILLPFGISAEADFLYKRTGLEFVESQSGDSTTQQKAANSWEFPLLAKLRLPGEVIRPYAAAGYSFRHLSDLKTFVTGADPANRGFVVAGGIQFKISDLRLSPEIRFTRWESDSDTSGLLQFNRNQAEFLLGITF